MKQKLKRFMAGFMAMLTLVGTLFTNGTTAFAASPQANIAFWNASVKNSGEVSELKPGYNHGKILYSILDGNSAYCMNFGLRADGGQLMNSYDDASTSMSAQQRKLLSYCLYYGFNSTQKAAPSNSQCDEYIATQAMVWVIVADIFGTGSGDSAARKLCNTAPSPDSSYSYYERLRDNISSSYNATLPSFASRRTSEAPTYELKWNEGSQRFETTLSDSNGVLSDFDFDTFSKSDFRVVKVKNCEAVPKSKKLLRFTLDDGTENERTILSGVHAFYEPEELVGKTLLAIVNLPPRSMMGIDSCGMLLSAIHNVNGEEKLNLVMLDDAIPAGAKLY